MMLLRYGKFERVPDIVVWPKNEHEVVQVNLDIVIKLTFISNNDVTQIVDAANRHNVVVIPIGGGTSVSNALECPREEYRCICSLDMALMDRVLWVDQQNLLCRAEVNTLFYAT